MSHEQKQNWQKPGRFTLSCPASCGDGFSVIPKSIRAIRPSSAGHCPTADWQQQRETRCLHVSHEITRLEQQRHPDASETRTRIVWTSDRDTERRKAEPRRMVCRDVDIPRLVSRNGHQTGGFRARIVLKSRPTPGYRKSASLTPSDGAKRPAIVPAYGVRAPPPRPTAGAIRDVFTHSLTPSHGNYLDIAIYTSKE